MRDTRKPFIPFIILAAVVTALVWILIVVVGREESPTVAPSQEPTTEGVEQGDTDPSAGQPSHVDEAGATITRGETPPAKTDERGIHLVGRLTHGGESKLTAGAAILVCAERPGLDLRSMSEISEFFGLIRRGEDLDAVATGLRRRPERSTAVAALDASGRFEARVEALPARFFVYVDDPLYDQPEFLEYAVPSEAKELSIEVPVRARACVEGRVLDEESQAVVGATVHLKQKPEFSPEMGRGEMPPPERKTLTDGQGRFHFDGVEPAEKYLLLAGLGEGLRHRSGALPSFALALGERLQKDVVLTGKERVSGVVKDPEGGPIAGATIFCRPKELGMMLFEVVVDPRGTRATTDASGRFELAGLTNVRHAVHVEAAGYRASDEAMFTPGEEGANEELVITMEPGFSIIGKVSGPDDAPAPGTPVHLTRSFSQSMLMGSSGRPFTPVRTVADAEGSFRFDGLEQGRFDILATSLDGTLMGERRRVRIKPAKEGPTEPVTCEIRLEPGGVLEGRVVDAKGKPVPRFRARLSLAVLQGFLPGTIASGVFAHPEGRFHLGGIAPGDYTLTIEGVDHRPFELEKVKVSHDGEELVVTLPPTGSLRGLVRLAATGEGVADARVTVAKDPLLLLKARMSGLVVQTTTDENGHFELAHMPAGEAVLRVEHDLYFQRAAATVDVPADGERHDVMLEVFRGATVEGTVSDTQGVPREGILVEARWSAGMQSRLGETDASGFYRVEGIPSGAIQVLVYDLEAMGEEGLAGLVSSIQTKNARVQEETTTVVNFGGLSRGARLRGIVREGGKPARGIMLILTEIRHADGTSADTDRFAATSRKGEYVFEDLPAGRGLLVLLRMEGDGQSISSELIEIPEEGEIVHDIDLSSASISGIVSDAGGKPITELSVMLMKMNGDDPDLAGRMQTDREGRYLFDTVQPGEYVVRAGDSFFVLDAQGNFTRASSDRIRVDVGQSLSDVDFMLHPGGSLEGAVRDASGAPIDRLRIRVIDAQGADSTETIGLGGHFEASGLHPGVVKAVIRARGYVTVEKENITIESGSTAKIQVIMERGIRVTVKVLDEEGAPIKDLSSIRAKMLAADGTSTPALLDIEGLLDRFGGVADPGVLELGSFAPGAYTLQVEAPGASPLDSAVRIDRNPNFAVEITIQLKRS